MTVAVSTLLGRPLWFELMTTDMKAAEPFYRTVVGWGVGSFEGSPQPYTLFKRSGELSVAGLMTKPDEVKAPPFWSMYVGVPKLEAAAAHIKKLGGKEFSPVIEVPTIGRMQMMTDPQGAAFYIYEPARADQQPEGPAAELGEVSWIELMTTDAPAALKFYSEVFGWQPSEAMDMGPMGIPHVQPPARDDRRHDEQATRNGARAAQLADLLPRARHQRGDGPRQSERRQILNGPMEVPGGDWIVNAMDPQGAAFSLHAKKAN